MRGDDLQVGEGGGSRVEADGRRVVEPDALPARLARPNAARPRVEQQHEAQLFAAFVQRPVPIVVWGEGLEGGMQLHALQAQLRDLAKLFDGALAFEWVDAPEPDEQIGKR